jgi:FkbM family methyltransferase
MKYLTSEIFFGEFNEYALEAFYCRWVKEGDTVIDGGANVGRHSISLQRIVKEKGLVIAIEPIPDLARKLRNLERIQVVQVALGRDSGFRKFQHVPNLQGWSGLKKRLDLDDAFEVEEIDVSISTLDALLGGTSKKVTFIKLDLEGGEFDALCGARELLLNSRAIVVFENSLNYSAELYDYNEGEFYKFFDSVNYSLLDFFGNTLKTFDFDMNQPSPWQFLAFPNELMESKVRRHIRRSCWKAVFKLNLILCQRLTKSVSS